MINAQSVRGRPKFGGRFIIGPGLRRQRLIQFAAAVIVASAAIGLQVQTLQAQTQRSAIGQPPATGQDVPVDAAEIQELMNDAPPLEPSEAGPSGIDLLTLIASGGAFMIPIFLMSLLVVALAFERFVMLRRRVIMPRPLERKLRDLCNPIERFDPSAAYEVCQQHPSQAATVIQAMLTRTGQPLADIERAATESVDREADRCASPIRWLTLAAAATPLMGLLGTVWGMIVAFHESTTLTPDQTRSEQLSEGIYTALVTTLAGLVVAIPAAILALYLENRLAKLFHRVQEFSFEIAAGLSRFTGRRRMAADGSMVAFDAATPPPAETAKHSGDAIKTQSPPRATSSTRGEAKAG